MKSVSTQIKEDRKPNYVTEILSRNIASILILNSIPRFCSMNLCIWIVNVLAAKILQDYYSVCNGIKSV